MKILRTNYVMGILIIIGMSLLLYPTAAAWIAQYNQVEQGMAYNNSVEDAIPDKAAQLAAAAAYNEALTAGAIIPANERLPRSEQNMDAVTTPDGREWRYNDILRLNDSDMIARLRIPTIDVDLPVYHGTSDETLLEGAGHLEGTAFPNGGPDTRVVITAHRGLASATIFTNLNKVGEGDRFTLEVFGEMLTYEVIEVQVVEPEDTEQLRVVPGSDLVTLVTCTPLGVNTHHILVTGQRIVPTPQSDLDKLGQGSDLPKFPWWAVLYFGVAGVNVAGLTVQTVRYVRDKRESSDEPASETTE